MADCATDVTQVWQAVFDNPERLWTGRKRGKGGYSEREVEEGQTVVGEAVAAERCSEMVASSTVHLIPDDGSVT